MDKFYIGLVPEEKAAGMPHETLPGTDMASVVNIRHGNIIMPVSYEALQGMYLTESDAFEMAHDNTDREPYRYEPMFYILKGLGMNDE